VDFETEPPTKLGFGATRKAAPHGALRRVLTATRLLRASRI